MLWWMYVEYTILILFLQIKAYTLYYTRDIIWHVPCHYAAICISTYNTIVKLKELVRYLSLKIHLKEKL